MKRELTPEEKRKEHQTTVNIVFLVAGILVICAIVWLAGFSPFN